MPDAPSDPAADRREESSPVPGGPSAAREAAHDSTREPAEAHELPYREELRRKALHLLSLSLPLGTALLGKRTALFILVPAALLALSCDVLRSRFPRFARAIRRLFGPLMRADEWSPGEEPSAKASFDLRINGATWTLVTMALLVLFFPVPVAVASFSLFMIGDAAAALVGRRYGRTPWGEGPRTVEGSAAFVVASALVTAPFVAFGYLALPWWVAALTVVAGAGAEALPRPLNDNLRVPFVAALVLYLLG